MDRTNSETTMTRDEAKLLLGLFRPDLDDPADPLFSEALSLLESDPELAEWFADEKSFDREVREAFSADLPPSALRDSLLAGVKVIRPSIFSRTPWIPVVLAIAAALVLVLCVTSLMRPSSVVTDPALAALALKIPALTDAHDHALESPGDFAPIRTWLAEHGGASDFVLPQSLQHVAGVACEVSEIEGQKVTILCFDLGGDRLAHLYVVKAAESAPGADRQPSFFELNGVAVAGWRDSGFNYFLAERGPLESVRQLL
jgi:hypothetical protein